MNNSSKTWSGFWSGLIWFVLGLVCITICQFVAVFILVAIETVQQGSRLSEDRVSELFLDGDLLAIASVLILPVMFIMLAFAVKVRRKKPLLDFLGFREVTIPVLAAFLTGMTDSRWLFESTGHFLNSAILTVIPLVQKIPGKSKALRDQLAIL